MFIIAIDTGELRLKKTKSYLKKDVILKLQSFILSHLQLVSNVILLYLIVIEDVIKFFDAICTGCYFDRVKHLIRVLESKTAFSSDLFCSRKK